MSHTFVSGVYVSSMCQMCPKRALHVHAPKTMCGSADQVSTRSHCRYRRDGGGKTLLHRRQSRSFCQHTAPVRNVLECPVDLVPRRHDGQCNWHNGKILGGQPEHADSVFDSDSIGVTAETRKWA